MGTTSSGAVLFDLDGVLVHTERVWHQLVSEAGERFGRGPVSWEKFISTFGQGIDSDIQHFAWSADRPTLEKFFQERFSSHLDAIQVNADAEVERPGEAPILSAEEILNSRMTVFANAL